MKTYLIDKIFIYTETVTVNASSDEEAFGLAEKADGKRNFNDTLQDCEIVSINGEDC